MPNRNLNSEELKPANELLADIRERLSSLSAGDPRFLLVYRRKVVKELGYDERSKPGGRAKLKALKWGQQNGKIPKESSVILRAAKNLAVSDARSNALAFPELDEILFVGCASSRHASVADSLRMTCEWLFAELIEECPVRVQSGRRPG